MRIVGGSLKGRRFNPPAKMKARPTTDMAKEALFNVLSNLIDFEDIEVLDLFCGGGGISLEFCSRGASLVVAVDVDPLVKPYLDKTAAAWDLHNLKTVKADVFKMLKNPQQQFDVVFADPPYADPRFAALPETLLGGNWLKPNGLLILEHGEQHSFEQHTALVMHKHYGSVNFSIFRKGTSLSGNTAS